MNKWVGFALLAAFLALFAGCGASSVDSGSMLTLKAANEGLEPAAGLREQAATREQAAMKASRGPAAGRFPPPVSLPAGGGPYFYSGSSFSAAGLQALPGGQPPSLASLSVEVDSMQGASLQVQAIAESLGGYVERLASSGGSRLPRSDITVKVPQDRFAAAMDRIEALGSVQFRSLGSEDITEQHIDLTARLAVYQREEQSLASLMERSSSVSELLSIERELARVRSNIELAQSRLSLLEQRVDLATIQVSLFPTGSLDVAGPSASFDLEVSSVMERVANLRKYVTDRGGEIDEVYLASSGDTERAELTFRVLEGDFDRATLFIEGQGRVTARELLEISNPPGENARDSRRPNASIRVTFVDSSGGMTFWTPLLVILVLAVMGAVGYYVMRLVYQRGRRRGSFI